MYLISVLQNSASWSNQPLLKAKKMRALLKRLKDQGISSIIWRPSINTTLDSVTVREFLPFVQNTSVLWNKTTQDSPPPKLEQIIRASESIEIELAVSKIAATHKGAAWGNPRRVTEFWRVC